MEVGFLTSRSFPVLMAIFAVGELALFAGQAPCCEAPLQLLSAVLCSCSNVTALPLFRMFSACLKTLHAAAVGTLAVHGRNPMQRTIMHAGIRLCSAPGNFLCMPQARSQCGRCHRT